MVVISHFKLYPALFPLKWLICIPNISAVRGNVDLKRFMIFTGQQYLHVIVSHQGKETLANFVIGKIQQECVHGQVAILYCEITTMVNHGRV